MVTVKTSAFGLEGIIIVPTTEHMLSIHMLVILIRHLLLIKIRASSNLATPVITPLINKWN